MGYIFLACALIAGLTKGYCGKKTSSFVSEYKDAAFSNMIRMFLCIIVGLGFVIVQSGAGSLLIDTKTFLISLLSGLCTSVFVVAWLLVVRKGAYMTIDVFTTLGIIIPLVLCNILYKEAVTPVQMLGIALLFIAVCIMCSYNNSIKEKLDFSKIGLLLLCGIANGLADFSQKLYVKETPLPDVSVFNFYTYVFSFVVLMAVYIIAKVKERSTELDDEKKLFKSIWKYIIILSVCLFLNSYFKTLAAMSLDSAQLYPINQGAAIILSSVMAAVLFKERINTKCIIGMVITFISIMLIK